MERFDGRLAVVTGGGTGMGRELTRQLVGAGCSVAMCDVSDAAMLESRDLALVDAPTGVVVSTFVADVSDEAALLSFRDHVRTSHQTEAIHLLFNNAGIGGGGSFVNDPRSEWEKVYAVCWGGVYLGTRTFLPMLLAAAEGHVVNTSSVNGFWACLGPNGAHTAYSAAKFAVKGFTEALVTDFRLNAPHLRASVVMPGHIGTSIVFNSGQYFDRHPKDLTDEHLAAFRLRFARRGLDASGASDEDLRTMVVQQAESFRDHAPTTAAEAATIILDGVRRNEWRILVGQDALTLDNMIRRNPTDAYEHSFMDELRAGGVFDFIQG
jgi:NAD(P)-dependent dehydrogenase (short-subunit alcohol dehydrogenase family)